MTHAPQSVTITARGHGNIQAYHPSTFEVTTDSSLTLKGDCIIGVDASHSAKDLKSLLKNALLVAPCQIRTTLKVGSVSDTILGWVSPELSFTDSSSIVWRTSAFVDDRTIAIRCDKAAKDIDRRLVAMLQNPESILKIQLVVG